MPMLRLFFYRFLTDLKSDQEPGGENLKIVVEC